MLRRCMELVFAKHFGSEELIPFENESEHDTVDGILELGLIHRRISIGGQIAPVSPKDQHQEANFLRQRQTRY